MKSRDVFQAILIFNIYYYLMVVREASMNVDLNMMLQKKIARGHLYLPERDTEK